MALYGKTHGMRYTREYSIWQAMRKRCLNPTAVNWKDYGGRGINICTRWDKFENFYADMGPANGKCIDRIDNNKGYSKSNCRWVTYTENNRNRRDCVKYRGKTMTEWSEITGISKELIWWRLRKKGMDYQTAITTPVMTRQEASALPRKRKKS